MGDAALDTKSDPLAIEGLEDVFVEDSPTENIDEKRTVQDETKDGFGSAQDSPRRLVHPITVEEAASILKISTNAVCKRLRKGSLLGQKIPGKFKDEWLVEGAGLIEIISIDFSKVQDSPETSLHENSSVQDQTKDSPGSVQDSPGEGITRLLDLVEKQAAKLEAAAGQIGYLQAQVESQTKELETKSAELKLLMDSQRKTSAWTRFWVWFTGQS